MEKGNDSEFNAVLKGVSGLLLIGAMLVATATILVGAWLYQPWYQFALAAAGVMLVWSGFFSHLSKIP